MEAAAKVRGVNRRELIQPMAGSDDACWLMKRVQERGGKATYIGIGQIQRQATTTTISTSTKTRWE
jgi:metal-dependent amidase/aminoacylase/carboxypeptidase family protein